PLFLQKKISLLVETYCFRWVLDVQICQKEAWRNLQRVLQPNYMSFLMTLQCIPDIMLQQRLATKTVIIPIRYSFIQYDIIFATILYVLAAHFTVYPCHYFSTTSVHEKRHNPNTLQFYPV